MKGLEKFIIIAVFILPVVVCAVILNDIWKEDENDIDKKEKNNIIDSISEPILVQNDDINNSGNKVNVDIYSGDNSGQNNPPDSTQISKIYTDALVNVALADVYISSDVTSERVGTMEKYSKITAQKASDGWSRVTGVDSKGLSISGWMKTENITFPNESNGDLNIKPTPGTGVVATEDTSLNVRRDPSTTSDILTTIPKGKTVVIEETVNGWHKISANGVTGWVSAKYIK